MEPLQRRVALVQPTIYALVMGVPNPVMQKLEQLCELDAGKLSALQVRVRWNIEGAGTWILDCRTGAKLHAAGAAESVDCDLFLSAQDLEQIARGELNPQHAFVERRLKICGDMGASLKVNRILQMLVS